MITIIIMLYFRSPHHSGPTSFTPHHPKVGETTAQQKLTNPEEGPQPGTKSPKCGKPFRRFRRTFCRKTMIHQKKVRISSSLMEIPSTTNNNTRNDADDTQYGDTRDNDCCVTLEPNFGARRRKNGFVMFRKSSSMSDVSNFKKGIDWSDDDVFLRDFNDHEKKFHRESATANDQRKIGVVKWCSGEIMPGEDHHPPKRCAQFHSFKKWTKKKTRTDDDVDSGKDKGRILTEDGRFKNIMSKISSIF